MPSQPLHPSPRQTRPKEAAQAENAGRSRQIAFHQGIHSDIGPNSSLVLTNDVRYPAIAVTPLNPL